MTDVSRANQIESVLLATAVGDAVGLPYEGLSPGRARRIFGERPLRHRLFLGYGTVSDDTDHAFLTAEALLRSGGDPDHFAGALAWRLRFWLLALPAGTGLATARAILKLWIGFPPSRSGVYSAGNGPAMRAAILGVYAADDIPKLRALVHTSTCLTHTDPVAEQGALAVALAAAYACRPEQKSLRTVFHENLAGTSILPLLDQAIAAADSSASTADFLHAIGLDRGVSGYINHTVPAALFCWLRWPPDFRMAVEQVILAGGDTDSTAAITAALASLTAGIGAIPADWLDPLILWPRSRRQAHALAVALDVDSDPSRFAGITRWFGSIPRNLLFLVIVLLHGFRRLLPPY